MSISIIKLSNKLFGGTKPLEGKALEVLKETARKSLSKEPTKFPRFYPRRDDKTSLADGYVLYYRWRQVKHIKHPTDDGKWIWPDVVTEDSWTEWTHWMRPWNAKWYEDIETAKHAVEQKNRTSEYWQEEYIIVPIALIAQDGSGTKDTLEKIITDWMKLNDDKSASGLATWIMKEIFNAK